MITRWIKQITVVASMAVALLGFAPMIPAASGTVLSPAVHAGSFKDDACSGVSDVGDGSKCGDGGAAFEGVFATIVSILSYVVGVVAIVMVIVAGFKYITSGGDSGKVASAKNTLIYALVGLIVAALAQTLIHFVLNSSSRALTKCEGHTYAQTDSRCTDK